MDALFTSALVDNVNLDMNILPYDETYPLSNSVVHEEIVVSDNTCTTQNMFDDALDIFHSLDTPNIVWNPEFDTHGDSTAIENTIDLEFVNDLLFDDFIVPCIESSCENFNPSFTQNVDNNNSLQKSIEVIDLSPTINDITVSLDETTFMNNCPVDSGSSPFSPNVTSGSNSLSPDNSISEYSSSWCGSFKAHPVNQPPTRKRKAANGSRKQPLLPYTIQDTQLQQENHYSDELDADEEEGALNNEDIIHGAPGDPIILTQEEKRLLLKEGMHTFPTHLPLTRTEEHLIRLIRRKMRNKKSAKVSRAKKQRYMGDLEIRVTRCTEENAALKRKAQELQEEKSSLIQQVERLKATLSYYMKLAGENTLPLFNNLDNAPPSHHTSVKRSFCLFFLITFAFFLHSVVIPIPTKGNNEAGSFVPYPGRSRTLLSERELAMDIPDPYNITVRPKSVWIYPPLSPKIELREPIKTSDTIDEIFDTNSTLETVDLQQRSVKPTRDL